MAIISTRVRSRKLQVSLVRMICWNRHIMHTEKYMVFNSTEDNLLSGFMQVFQAYSNNVSKDKATPTAWCICPTPLSPAFADHKISCLPSHPHATSSVATTLSQFCHTEKSSRLLNTENCISIPLTEAVKPLRLSPLRTVLLFLLSPGKQKSHPLCLSPLPLKQTYRTSGQKCKGTPQHTASCCR